MSNTLLNEWQECLSLLCTRSLKGGFPSPPDPHQHLIKCDISCGLFGLGPLLCWSMIIILLFCGETFPWINHKLGQLIFFFIYSKYPVFLFILLCIVCTILISFHMLSYSYINGISPTWSWCRMLLMCCWICYVSSLLRMFASVFIRDICIYFSYSVCFVLVSGWWYCSHKITMKVFPLFSLSSVKIGISSLNVW